MNRFFKCDRLFLYHRPHFQDSFNREHFSRSLPIHFSPTHFCHLKVGSNLPIAPSCWKLTEEVVLPKSCSPWGERSITAWAMHSWDLPSWTLWFCSELVPREWRSCGFFQIRFLFMGHPPSNSNTILFQRKWTITVPLQSSLSLETRSWVSSTRMLTRQPNEGGNCT